MFSFEMVGKDGHLVLGEPDARFFPKGDLKQRATKPVVGAGAPIGFWQFLTDAWSVGDTTGGQEHVFPDTGTSCIALSPSLYNAFKNACGSDCDPPLGKCNKSSGPTITLYIDNHAFTLEPSTWCVDGSTCVQESPGGRGPTILGDVFHRKYYTIYNFGTVIPTIHISLLDSSQAVAPRFRSAGPESHNPDYIVPYHHNGGYAGGGGGFRESPSGGGGGESAPSGAGGGDGSGGQGAGAPSVKHEIHENCRARKQEPAAGPEERKGMSGGHIALIVATSVLAVILVAVIGWLFCWRAGRGRGGAAGDSTSDDLGDVQEQ